MRNFIKDDMMIKCEICEREFMELSNHIVRTHKIKIEDYYLTYINPVKKICVSCGKDVAKFNNINEGYFKKCLKCNSTENICKICGMVFARLEGLTYHITQTHKITKEEYYLKFIGEKGKCEKCGKDTKFKNIRDGYLNECHNCNGPYICEICKMECSSISSLTYHITQKHRITKEEYYLKYVNSIKGKCEKCGKDTKFKNIRDGYMKLCSICNGAINNICKICKKQCINVQSLSKHIRQTHKIEPEEYYLRYINSEKSKCIECGNFAIFIDINLGYKKFCSHKCSMINSYTNKKRYETLLKNNNGINPCKLTYQKCLERYPLLVQVEELKEGPNGEIWGHCKNSSCKNSKENGGYFDVSKFVGDRNDGINGNDTGHFYCSEECKHSCPLFGRSAAVLHNLLNENKNIPYTQEEYNTWHEEVLYRQRIENNTDINFCEKCHATENLHVHHEVPQKIVPGYSLDPDNGIIFCKDCHYEIGHEKGTECSTGNLANKICK
jgi:hypothetical protein